MRLTVRLSGSSIHVVKLTLVKWIINLSLVNAGAGLDVKCRTRRI